MRYSIKVSLIGICFLCLAMNLIPLAQSQATIYQSYFWIHETGNNLSAISTTGDLDANKVQVSEVVVVGQGNVTLLDGYLGVVLANYSIAPTLSFNAVAVGNLDGDSSNEIAAGSLDANLLITLKYNQANDNFTVLWEKNYPVTQVQIEDLTGDAQNEVVIGDSLGNLTVFFQNGTLLWSSNLTESIITFQCLDFTQDGIIDGIIVLTNTLITLINATGTEEWQVGASSTPLNALSGDVTGDQSPEIIVKTQNFTNCFTLTGGLLWNSSSYMSESPALLLYNSTVTQKFEILVGGNNGSYLLFGTNGSRINSYLSNSSVTCVAIGAIYGYDTDCLVMGDRNKNLTVWIMEDAVFLSNITLSGIVVDLILSDMNNNGDPDIIAASFNGTVYVIGLPWMVDFTWVMIGIGIGVCIIIATVFIVMKKKAKKTPP
jgi:hypothetical protein